MPLTPEQVKAREGKLTASQVGALMSGNTDKIMNLWQRLVGDPAYVEEDLSDVWPVALGEVTEQLNLNWYERRTGHAATRRGEVVIHPRVPWAACTLDGWVDALKCPIECKHVSGRVPFDKIVERYMPQTHWQMEICKAQQCILQVIEGANEPRREVIGRNPEYADELWMRAEKFMECVRNLTPPVALAPVAAPIAAVREVDMSRNNQWAGFASDWLANAGAAKRHAAAEQGLKNLVPADVRLAKGHGVSVARDRANRMRVSGIRDQGSGIRKAA